MPAVGSNSCGPDAHKIGVVVSPRCQPQDPLVTFLEVLDMNVVDAISQSGSEHDGAGQVSKTRTHGEAMGDSRILGVTSTSLEQSVWWCWRPVKIQDTGCLCFY